MAISFELNASARNPRGKAAARRLRRDKKVPGILYGGGKESVSVTFDHESLREQLNHEAFFSHILTVKVDGAEERAILRDVQRHPAQPRILHIDLQRVVETEKIRFNVPLHFLNEQTAVGVKQQGGVVSHLTSEVEVSCFPKDLPEYIEVDLVELQLGQSIHLSELKLPERVELLELAHGEQDRPVVSIMHPRAEEEELAAAPEAGAAEVPTVAEEEQAKEEAEEGED